MKYYKVNLYHVLYMDNGGAVVSLINPVIVQKGMRMVKEILTGYSRINIVPKRALTKKNDVITEIDKHYRNRSKAIKDGAHLFVVEEDLCAQNGVRSEDIGFYVDEFEGTKWSRIYEGMKQLSPKEKKLLSKSVKEVAGTKR